jgi:hypothetical protein
MARMEKQRDKAAKRVERKAAKEAGITDPDDDLDNIQFDEFGVPILPAENLDDAGLPDDGGSQDHADSPEKVKPPETAPKE